MSRARDYHLALGGSLETWAAILEAEAANDWLMRVADRVTEQVREWRKEDEDNGRPW